MSLRDPAGRMPSTRRFQQHRRRASSNVAGETARSADRKREGDQPGERSGHDVEVRTLIAAAPHWPREADCRPDRQEECQGAGLRKTEVRAMSQRVILGRPFPRRLRMNAVWSAARAALRHERHTTPLPAGLRTRGRESLSSICRQESPSIPKALPEPVSTYWPSLPGPGDQCY